MQPAVREMPARAQEIGEVPLLRHLHHLRSHGSDGRGTALMQEMRRGPDIARAPRAPALQLQRPRVRLPLRQGRERASRARLPSVPPQHPANRGVAGSAPGGVGARCHPRPLPHDKNAALSGGVLYLIAQLASCRRLGRLGRLPRASSSRRRGRGRIPRAPGCTSRSRA